VIEHLPSPELKGKKKKRASIFFCLPFVYSFFFPRHTIEIEFLWEFSSVRWIKETKVCFGADHIQVGPVPYLGGM
jgi:hypothetical protein